MACEAGRGPPFLPRIGILWRRDSLFGFLVIGASAAGGSIFAAWGMARTTASNGALLNLTIPALTALLAAVVLHERMSLARWISLVIALAGVLVLSIKAPESATKEGLAIDWRNLGLLNKDYAVGNLLILVSCITSCLYNVASKSLVSRFSTLEVLTYSYIVAFAVTIAMCVCFEPMSPSVVFCLFQRYLDRLAVAGRVRLVAADDSVVVLVDAVGRQSGVGFRISAALLSAFFWRPSSCTSPITFPMIAGGAVTLFGTILLACSEPTVPTAEQMLEEHAS